MSDEPEGDITLDEIIRWFRRFKHDPEFRDENGSLTVRLAPLCEIAGLARQNVHRILRKEIALTENYRVRLEYAIECVQNGLRWQRRGGVYHIVGDGTWQQLPRYESGRPRTRRAA